MTEARRRRGRVFSSSESRPGGSGWYIADRDKHWVQLLYDMWPKFSVAQVPKGPSSRWHRLPVAQKEVAQVHTALIVYLSLSFWNWWRWVEGGWGSAYKDENLELLSWGLNRLRWVTVPMQCLGFWPMLRADWALYCSTTRLFLVALTQLFKNNLDSNCPFAKPFNTFLFSSGLMHWSSVSGESRTTFGLKNQPNTS